MNVRIPAVENEPNAKFETAPDTRKATLTGGIEWSGLILTTGEGLLICGLAGKANQANLTNRVTEA